MHVRNDRRANPLTKTLLQLCSSSSCIFFHQLDPYQARVAGCEKTRSVVQRYGLAVLSVASALGLEIFLRGRIPGLFWIAIALTVWYAGVGPGILALVLSISALNYFTEPRYSFHIIRDDIPYYATFILFALLIAWFSAVRRRVERNLLQSRDELQREVAIRTQQKAYLDELFEQAPEGVVLLDVEDRILRINREFTRVFGYTPDEAVGRPINDLIAPEELLGEAIDYPHLILHGKAVQVETIRQRKDGDRIPVSLLAVPVSVHGGQIAEYAIYRDLTGYKAVEGELTKQRAHVDEIRGLNEELARRSRDLEATNKELEAFAYSISHDLRAPLRHIAGYTELLRKQVSPVVDEKSNRYLTTILESAKRMGDLIDDLLALSRIGRAETQKTLVDLEHLLREVLTEVRPDFEGRQITWKISGLPSVEGDRSMLRMALENLLSNAIKFTRTRPQAEIEIGCADGKKNEVVVFVKDNGVGFDMKYVNKLFRVFQRLHHADAFEGTGIGLATVQRIIHRHGGSVWAEGAVDKGATFYFSIPTPQGYLWKPSKN